MSESGDAFGYVASDEVRPRETETSASEMLMTPLELPAPIQQPPVMDTSTARWRCRP